MHCVKTWFYKVTMINWRVLHKVLSQCKKIFIFFVFIIQCYWCIALSVIIQHIFTDINTFCFKLTQYCHDESLYLGMQCASRIGLQKACRLVLQKAGFLQRCTFSPLTLLHCTKFATFHWYFHDFKGCPGPSHTEKRKLS